MESINHPGLIADDYLPDEDEVYVTPDVIEERYGITATEAQIRTAMVLMHDYCNRRTLWPSEYMQRITLASDRSQGVLAVRPVLRILEAKGRYTLGRRDNSPRNHPFIYSGLEIMLGRAPGWIDITTDTIEFYAPTGEIWIPTGALLAPYGEVQIKYTAGYAQIPEKAIMAIALLINSICSKGDGDMISYTAGRVSRRFNTASFITRDIKRLLNFFAVRSYE